MRNIKFANRSLEGIKLNKFKKERLCLTNTKKEKINIAGKNE